MAQSIDFWGALTSRLRKPIGVLSAAWFTLTCAAQADFIELPQLRFLTGLPAMIVAAIWNATWWGFLYPRVHNRRVERAVGKEASNG